MVKIPCLRMNFPLFLIKKIYKTPPSPTAPGIWLKFRPSVKLRKVSGSFNSSRRWLKRALKVRSIKAGGQVLGPVSTTVRWKKYGSLQKFRSNFGAGETTSGQSSGQHFSQRSKIGAVETTSELEIFGASNLWGSPTTWLIPLCSLSTSGLPTAMLAYRSVHVGTHTIRVGPKIVHSLSIPREIMVSTFKTVAFCGYSQTDPNGLRPVSHLKNLCPRDIPGDHRNR